MTEQEFLAIWQGQTIESVELEYRLYYDDLGFPLFYSTEKVDGNYIVVDKETYLNSPKHIRIIDGKIKVVKTVFGKKLAPSDQGRACDPSDVCVLVDESQPNIRWTIKHEEPIDDQED